MLTVAELAAEARVSEKTVRRAVASGDLEAFRIGSAVRIDEDAARLWMRARPIRPTEVRMVRRRAGRGRPERGGYADLMAIDRKAAT